MNSDPSSGTARTIEIHRAVPEQAERLSQIAWAAKASLGYPIRWLELWKEALTVSPEFIETNPVFVASSGGSAVAFVALVPESGTRWLLEHLWVSPPQMKQGIGRQLVRVASDFARAKGVRELAIDAEPLAEPFYLRLGAVRVGESVGTIDGHPRVRPQLVLFIDTVNS